MYATQQTSHGLFRRVVMQGGEALRDNPNNSCKGDHASHATNLKAVMRYAVQIAQQNDALIVLLHV